jgi:polar amino acid transport system substrate-binding protein
MTRHSLTQLLLGGIAVAAALGVAHAAETVDMLTVAVPDGTTPFGTLQEGKLMGFDGALLDKFEASAGIKIRAITVPPEALLETLKSGKADIAASSMQVTPSLESAADVSLPTAEITDYVLIRKGDPDLHGLADLSGKEFGKMVGPGALLELTELEHRLGKLGGTLGTPHDYPNESEAEADLAGGRIAYIVNHVVELAASPATREGRFEIFQPVGHRVYTAWATVKSNEPVKTLLQRFMASERESGDLAALQKRWLGRSFDDLPNAVTLKDWWVAREDRPALVPIPSVKDPD